MQSSRLLHYRPLRKKKHTHTSVEVLGALTISFGYFHHSAEHSFLRAFTVPCITRVVLCCDRKSAAQCWTWSSTHHCPGAQTLNGWWRRGWKFNIHCEWVLVCDLCCAMCESYSVVCELCSLWCVCCSVSVCPCLCVWAVLLCWVSFIVFHCVSVM